MMVLAIYLNQDLRFNDDVVPKELHPFLFYWHVGFETEIIALMLDLAEDDQQPTSPSHPFAS